MAPSSEPQNEIFETIRYVLVSSISFSRAEELRHVLDSNGAISLDQGLQDTSLTTVITNSNRFEGWEDISQRQGVDVVTDKWVERSLILGRIQLPQFYSPDPAMIFSGVVGCACELPSADLEVLSAGITALGGQWKGGLTKEVTHLFALSAGGAKYSTAMHYRQETGVRVMLPHWFDDSVRLGMGCLSTKPYEWPDPEILKGIDSLTSGKDKGKAPAGSTVEHDDVKLNLYATAAIFTPSHGRSSPPTDADISLVLNSARGESSNVRPTQVWNGRKILLSRTLELYKGRREAVHIGIERAGGVIVRFEGDEDEPEGVTEQGKQQGKELSRNERRRRQNEAQRAGECDILVTRWRYGGAYVRACKAGKVIGTLAWLFHVQSTGILSNPQDQLLHYPVPKRLIDAFSNHVITVTNYTGEAREYIKKLIHAMGATFTPSMSGQNTVLIAAYIDGTKAAKAQSWSIPVVNHTWLEDCFIQWRNLTVALEKYIVFPPGVNFSTLLGERGVGVGSNVLAGLDDLASTVFEEDEVSDGPSDSEGDGHAEHAMAVDVPQRTERSAKEVATNLVDDNIERNLSESVSKVPPKKLVAPAGMDIEFEPPSTALIANQVEWDVDLNDDDQNQFVKDDEREGLGVTNAAAKPKTRIQEEEEEDGSEINGSSKQSRKGKPKAQEVAHGHSPKRLHDSSPGKRKDGPLKVTKADARTRIKRKSGKVPVESGEEGEVIETGGKRPQKKTQVFAATTDEEEDTRPIKSKAQATLSKDRKRKAPSRPQPSKPLRVYWSDEVESEDGETVASVTNGKPADNGSAESDNELPAVHLSSTPHRKTNASSGNATGKARVQPKRKTSNGVKPLSPTANKPQTMKTPKRTVSVLVPSLTIAGSSKKNGGKAFKDSHQTMLPFERNAKSKSKFHTPISDSSDEAEVEEIVSPGPRSDPLKHSSPKTQSSSKDIKTKGRDHKGRKRHLPSITVLRKPSRSALPEPMEVDDDQVPGSTPDSTASFGLARRSAAAKATQKLRETIMPDLVNFEAQMKKSKGKGRQSGSLNAFALDMEKKKEQGTGKRKISRHREEEEESEPEEEVPKKKRRISDENDLEAPKPKSNGKQKAKNDDRETSGSSEIVLLTTQVTLPEDVVRVLTRLGVRMTTRPSECTHLLAPHLVRTEKFLCALASAPFILSARWATASAAAKKLLPEKDFILKDEAGEKKYGTDLAGALRRAKSNKGKLLEGKMFYVTPRVAIDKKLLKSVVNALGGQVTNQAPSIRIISANPEMRHVISCKEDISIWRPIAAQGYKIYNQELLLMGGMKQKLEWERPEFMVEPS